MVLDRSGDYSLVLESSPRVDHKWTELDSIGYSKVLDRSEHIAILARERCAVGVTSSERVAGEVICEVAEVKI